MGIKSQFVLAVFVACLSVWGGSAHAQEDGLSEAREAFDAGQDAFQAGKFTEAAEHFKKAYAARDFSQFLFNIGACYEKAKDYPQALAYYEKYLATKPADEDAAKTRKRVDALRKMVTDIQAAGGDPRRATEEVQDLGTVDIRGLVVIESEPQGAKIYLDSTEGKPLSVTPWNGTLAGEHKIIIQKDGYKPVERTIRPDPNKLFLFVASLGEADYLGFLDVTSNVPGADIYIDDKSVGAKAKTPWSGQLQPGKHTVWVTKEGYDEHEVTVEVRPGQTYKVAASLEGAEVGFLNVHGKGVEKVKVVVNGDVLCQRGPCRKPLAPGMHRVSIRRSGYKSYSQKIEVQSKTEVNLRARLAPEPSRADAVVTYLFAAAFAGGGYYLGTRAQSIEDELAEEIESGSPPPDSNDPRLGWGLKSGKTYATASNVSYALSGSTFLLAVYYTFRDKGRPSTGTSDIRAIALQPQLQPGFQGLGLAGSF